MDALNLKPALLIAALAAGGLLAACGSSSGDSPFVALPTGTPAPTMEPTPTPPPPEALFDGDAAAFLVFLRDLDTAGDPVAVNDGNVRFNDVADNTQPISVNN